MKTHLHTHTHTRPTMWRVGAKMRVRVKGRSRRGTLVSKKLHTWRFRPDGWSKTVPVCPFRSKWHFDSEGTWKAWPQKLRVVLFKKTLKPFKRVGERIGPWCGAKAATTVIKEVPVWQREGTNELVVGHFGAYRLASVRDGKFGPLLTMPRDGLYFIGRGRLEPRTFKCLKTVRRLNAKRIPACQMEVKYKTLSRDELL